MKKGTTKIKAIVATLIRTSLSRVLLTGQEWLLATPYNSNVSSVFPNHRSHSVNMCWL